MMPGRGCIKTELLEAMHGMRSLVELLGDMSPGSLRSGRRGNLF